MHPCLFMLSHAVTVATACMHPEPCEQGAAPKILSMKERDGCSPGTRLTSLS